MKCKKILLDTDIGPDCDDAGALALLHIFANKGYCQILGIGHCTSNPYGAGAIDVISRFYGRPELAVGTYYGKDFLADENCMRYNRYLTTHFDNRYKESQPEEAVKMYRRVLAAQKDGSVEFVAIGPLNNLSLLLDSKPDCHSKLDGVALVNKKVKRLVMMGGIFRSSSQEVNTAAFRMNGKEPEEFSEYNIVCDIAAAQNVADNWPTPKVYAGFETGLFLTGKTLSDFPPETHPVQIAYKLWTQGEERYSWDLVTVEYAVNDDCPHYRTSAKGNVRFNNEGRTIWTEAEDGRDCFVELNQEKEEIARDINEFLRS